MLATGLDIVPVPSTACPNFLVARITCNKTAHLTIYWASSNHFLPENISGSVIRNKTALKKCCSKPCRVRPTTSHLAPHCSLDKQVACVFFHIAYRAQHRAALLVGQTPDRDGCHHPLPLHASFACSSISWRKHKVFSVCRASSVDHTFSCSYPALVYPY
jgi:hypothetical protein